MLEDDRVTLTPVSWVEERSTTYSTSQLRTATTPTPVSSAIRCGLINIYYTCNDHRKALTAALAEADAVMSHLCDTSAAIAHRCQCKEVSN